MNAAKIQLSSREMQLVGDPSWILTKNSIMAKAVTLMAELSVEYRAEWERGGNNVLPAGGAGGDGGAGGNGDPGAGKGYEPKISRGENYKGLPYVMLDFPRLFGREDVFAIRTMFWWGHAFHVTLHLKGRYMELFLPVIRQRISMLGAAGFQVGVSEDEWQHELTPDNYRAIGSLPEGADILDRERGHNNTNSFLKLAAPCPLGKWNEAPTVLLELFRVLVRALGEPDR